VILLYRVKVYDHPIPHGTGQLIDYIPKDLPHSEAVAVAVEAKARFPREHFHVRPADGPPSRDALAHAIAVVADKHGVALPCRPQSLTRSELNLAGAFVARASNHGNRSPKPAMALGVDNQGRLVVKLGGAR
jgi:hypothetical protein